MPTVNPRVTVVLDQETYETIKEFCALSSGLGDGKLSMSRFIGDSMAKAAHTLHEIIPLLRIADQMNDHATIAASNVLGDAKINLDLLTQELASGISGLTDGVPSGNFAGVAPAACEMPEGTQPPYINKGVSFSEVRGKNLSAPVIYHTFGGKTSDTEKGG